MLILWGTLATAVLLITPIYIQADLRHYHESQVQIMLRWGPIRRIWRLKLAATPQGHRILLTGPDGAQHPFHPADVSGSHADRMLRALMQADKARRFLLHRTKLRTLQGMICLRTEDAAHTAIISGALQSLTQILPRHWRHKIRLCVKPDFYRAHTTLQARCILQLHLGIIIITAGMLLASYIAMQRKPAAREAA